MNLYSINNIWLTTFICTRVLSFYKYVIIVVFSPLQLESSKAIIKVEQRQYRVERVTESVNC